MLDRVLPVSRAKQGFALREESMMTAFVRAAVLVAMGISGVAGCVTPGTRLHDMSAAGHEAAAANAEAAARPAKEQDRPSNDSRGMLAVAAQHRAAAEALRQAEAQACVGISERDRDISPLATREDIVAVTRFDEWHRNGSRVAGAVIEVRAAPGLTAEWLQRRIDCHLARSAVLGFDQPDMGVCPLALKGVAAKVRPAGNRFLVEVSAGDASLAPEILRRSRALVASAR